MEEKEIVKRQPININFEQGIVPKNYNELLQFSALLHKSGLVPKSLDTLEKVAISVLMCLELGRSPAVGIQDIAVINGRAGIFGDAALAIVRASGLLEKFKEWEEGTPYTEDWTFYCLMKRKGMPDERKGSWSWQDTMRAGFDKIGPPSPWAKYTRRMMQFRARSFPLRDEFGDVLKGIKLSEDNMDAIDMYQDETGSNWKPQEEAKTEKVKIEVIDNADVDFQAFIRDLAVSSYPVDQAKVDAFIKETAKANGLTEAEVKKEILKDKDSFKKALEKWVGEKEKDSGKQDGPDLFDRLKAMRPGTSEQNKAVFKKQVLENLDEIRSWPDKDRDYITLKWSKHISAGSFTDVSLTEILAETVKEEEEKTQTEGYVDAIKTKASEDRDPNPPKHGDKDEAGVDFMKATVHAEFTDEKELEHMPPWTRRKHFLKNMEALHDKNKTVYFNTMGANGYTSLDDVPAEADKEAEILSIIQSEIPG